MEVELAKAKLDVMNLDSQLMEAIQQKIELSQQLEQWQVSSTITHHQVVPWVGKRGGYDRK